MISYSWDYWRNLQRKCIQFLSFYIFIWYLINKVCFIHTRYRKYNYSWRLRCWFRRLHFHFPFPTWQSTHLLLLRAGIPFQRPWSQFVVTNFPPILSCIEKRVFDWGCFMSHRRNEGRSQRFLIQRSPARWNKTRVKTLNFSNQLFLIAFRSVHFVDHVKPSFVDVIGFFYIVHETSELLNRGYNFFISQNVNEPNAFVKALTFSINLNGRAFPFR